MLAENYVRVGERRSAWQAVAHGLNGSGMGHDAAVPRDVRGTVLVRLAYLTVTNTFAALRMLPMTRSGEGHRTSVLRHQVAVLERLGATTHPTASAVRGRRGTWSCTWRTRAVGHGSCSCERTNRTPVTCHLELVGARIRSCHHCAPGIEAGTGSVRVPSRPQGGLSLAPGVIVHMPTETCLPWSGVVGRVGLEPTTYGLKVRSSAN